MYYHFYKGKAGKDMRYRLYSVISLFLITIMGIMSAFTIKAEDLPKVIVATDASLPPMEFLDSKGNIKGFDIEVMNVIAKEAGFKVEYRNTKWNNIFAGLKSSRFDAAISCIIVTRERAKRYAFSIPYANVGQVLVVPRSLDKEIKDLEDMKDKVIGVKLGSPSAYMARRIGPTKVKTYRSLSSAFRHMYSGKIQGVICPLVKAAYYVKYKKDYKDIFMIKGGPITYVPCAVAIKKGDKHMLDLINKGIGSIKKKDIDKKLACKWLGIGCTCRPDPDTARP